MKIPVLVKAFWKALWKPALAVAVVCLFLVFGDYIVALLSLSVTVAHLIAVVFSTIMQCKTVCHEGRMHAREQDVIAGWCLLGILPALAFGHMQWSYLIYFPWKLMLPATIVFACLYVVIYWKWLYRIMSNYTEGRDYWLATQGTSPLSRADAP